jgi:TetR/AcrR family transcriptional regulator
MAARRASKRGRPLRERGKETEEQILDAAEQVFAQNGYSGTRMQEIADAVGVTKAMIHYYFETKELLFRAVLDRILFELIKLVQEVTTGEASRVGQLERFIRGFFDYVARHPHFGRLTFFVAGREGRYFDNIVTSFFRPLFERGVAFIQEGVEEGTFREVDAEQLLLSIYAITMGYLADAHFISVLLEGDALGPDALKARREALLDMVYSTLGVSPE